MNERKKEEEEGVNNFETRLERETRKNNNNQTQTPTPETNTTNTTQHNTNTQTLFFQHSRDGMKLNISL
jgi:hypothetical protein